MTDLVTEIRKLGASFPDSRTATLPALRLVQEANGGWLTPESNRWARHSA